MALGLNPNQKVAEVDRAGCSAETVGADLKLQLNLEDTLYLKNQ